MKCLICENNITDAGEVLAFEVDKFGSPICICSKCGKKAANAKIEAQFLHDKNGEEEFYFEYLYGLKRDEAIRDKSYNALYLLRADWITECEYMREVQAKFDAYIREYYGWDVFNEWLMKGGYKVEKARIGSRLPFELGDCAF